MHVVINQAFIHLRNIWQYRWVALTAALLIAVAGWGWVHNLPDRFEATTRVYIDSDSVLRPLLKGLAVETDVEQQLKLMTRTLLSRPNVEKIMRMTDMDINVTTPSEKERMISRLTNTIRIKKMGRERDINLYQITYMNNERELAKQVVQSLLTILIEGSLGDKREDSDSARIFLTEQINEYEARLIAAEDRLTSFKQVNVGVLPEQGGGYYQSLRTFKADRDQAALALREARDRRDSVQLQLEELIATGRLSTSSDSVVISPLQSRVLALQTRLDEMLLKFTEQHPNVQELRRQIALLESQQAEEYENLSNNGEAGLKNNPLYQNLKLAQANSEADVAALRSRVKEYEKRIQNLQKQIETLPQIEAELKRLDRDYVNNKKNYDALISRRESANLASRAEMAGDTIKFRVIDPPWVPYSASEPKRSLLNSAVLLAAISGGLGLAFLISQIRPVIFDRKELQELTGVPVWGGVSLTLSDSELADNKRQLVMVSGIVVMLFVLYAAVMMFELKQLDMFIGLG